MTDNDLDSGSTEGTPAQPNAGSSSAQNDSGGSFDATKLQATLEALTRKLDEVDARSRVLQSEKDKGISQTKKEVDDLKHQFAAIEKLTKSGLDLDTAVEEYDFRSTVRQLKDQLGKTNTVSTPPAGNGNTGTVDMAKVFEEYELDSRDPRVIVEMAKHVNKDKDAIELAAFKLRKSLAQTPTPTPPQTPSPTGTAQRVDVTAKIQRLAELQRQPTKYKAEIQKLTAELDAVGWGG